MKAAVWKGNNKFEVEEVPQPEIPPGGMLVKVSACGICGSDLVKMRDGIVQPPVVLGHEVSGVIAELAAGEHHQFKEGDAVVVGHHAPCGICHYCRHDSPSMCSQFKSTNIYPGGFAEYFATGGENLAKATFKHNVPHPLAAITEPVACCLRSVHRCKVYPGDTAWVVGAGFIGLLMTQILVRRGLQVVATDLDESRLAMAREFGASAAFPARSRKAINAIMELSDGRGADLIVQTAGTSASYEGTLRYIRDGGIINVFSSVPRRDRLTVDLNQIYYRDITVIGSYSPAPQDMAEALRLITTREIAVEPLITHRVGLDAVGDAVEAIYRRECLKAVVVL